ncbi:hypothetical protein NC797_06110 [Aquibacillus sp. 3ASR75-11]|uniref:Histone deacetylase n=1 Tax=Terrihalobacillus insolitus TaxID=2950438 RepID=A0A9X3WRL8_9BACI|nr:hypothetical protein [Terrihalobacillus insolitus]MDC3424080.1 hypothetical protein [Terrihalobacillus insolitus]
MTEDQTEYVWYASYGSNLCEERFLCYILGGRPPGSAESEVGARDKTLPRDSQPVKFKFPLYFTGYSSRWGGGGAVIGLTEPESEETLGRMFLITKEQFVDVVRQENGIDDFEIDFEKVIKNKSFVMQESFYGNIVYTGDCEGYPIFTFTSYRDMKDNEISIPSESYLKMLIRGYQETFDLTNKEIAEYLIIKPGVQGHYTKDRLMNLISD